MKKKWEISKEEFEALKEAISDVLGLYKYEFIEANSEDTGSTSMSKETFFKTLEREFIIKN